VTVGVARLLSLTLVWNHVDHAATIVLATLGLGLSTVAVADPKPGATASALKDGIVKMQAGRRLLRDPS